MKLKMIITAILAVSVVAATGVIMTGCGGQNDKSSAATTTTATAGTTQATSTQTAGNSSLAQGGNSQAQNGGDQAQNENNAAQSSAGEQSGDGSSNEVGGITREDAIANVKAQAGSGAQILSAEVGESPEGLTCWVVTVSPVTNSEEAKTVTYYSGYQFCYADSYGDAQPDDSDNGDSNGVGGISQQEAVANVRQQAGSGAQILSVEVGESPEGLPCYIVVVAPVSNSEETETVTYYSGYMFCYAQ